MPELAALRGDVQAALALLLRIDRRIRTGVGERGVLPMLGERLLALAGELSWELGVVDPADADESVPDRARLDHVGVVVRDLASAGALYGEVLGGKLVAGGIHAGLGARTAHFEFPGGGKVELLQPIAPGGISDFLERRGEGTHHFAYFVDEIGSIVTDLECRSFRVVDRTEDETGWEEAYVSPRSAHGCVIQLIRSPERIPEAEGITMQEILADGWEWMDHRPRHVGHGAED